ncbi:MAG: chromate transporter [Pseudoflavonifractor sp.]
MIFLSLFSEFFQVGLFSVGGGLATIPFLQRMGVATGWFSPAELVNMIAVSESTPGPMGINMASYVGFTAAGPLGCAVATLGLITPSIVVILIVAKFLQRFRRSRIVDDVFSGLRPASTGLVAAAGIAVARIALMTGAAWTGLASLTGLFHWKGVLLAAAVFVCLQIKPLKKIHPILFIAASAVIGIVFAF